MNAAERDEPSDELHAPLPSGLARAYLFAATELGFASAAWIFARETARDGGAARVRALRAVHGDEFPVLDRVCTEWLAGHRGPPYEPAALEAALRGLRRVLVVGLEAEALDALAGLARRSARDEGSDAGALRVGVYAARSLGAVDWDRLCANGAGGLERVEPERFQEWAGARSAMLTFVYGDDGESAHVAPEWLRVLGPDTRPQFRALLGVYALRGALARYPRWLTDAPLDEFTAVLR